MIRLENVGVTYSKGITALKGCSLTFKQGEFVVLLGQSGAGKSTLLRCLNGLVRPTQGRVISDRFGDLGSAQALARHRRRTGMVFQNHHLIGRLSALQNVLTGRLGYHPAWRTLFPLPQADSEIALRALDRVGLLDKALARADELSGGQRQRVGVARALAQEPDIILADEPVASLDPATAAAVLEELRAICAKDGITAIVSLHQVDLARRFADRIIGIAGGAVVAETDATRLTQPVIDAIYRSGQDSARTKKAAHRPTKPDHPESQKQHVAMEASL